MNRKRKTKKSTRIQAPLLKREFTHTSKPDRVQIGDIVTRYPLIDCKSNGSIGIKEMRGMVVFVHPKGRFHTVEFGRGDYIFRECFYGAAK